MVVLSGETVGADGDELAIACDERIDGLRDDFLPLGMRDVEDDGRRKTEPGTIAG